MLYYYCSAAVCQHKISKTNVDVSGKLSVVAWERAAVLNMHAFQFELLRV